MGGVVTHSRTTTLLNGASQPTTDTKNTYLWWDNALLDVITYKPDITQSSTNTSDNWYDIKGHLGSVTISDGRPRTATFINDANGLVLSRDEADSSGSR
jgi:hypothetical protein